MTEFILLRIYNTDDVKVAIIKEEVVDTGSGFQYIFPNISNKKKKLTKNLVREIHSMHENLDINIQDPILFIKYFDNDLEVFKYVAESLGRAVEVAYRYTIEE